ncbi:hypothetical protein IQ241_09050 [Romeria aff. gracilis LEGE 07310]|uniref:Uncharacterized protein n=1 Tax=Vasconcelosia minhoensis LEGE 07310 TaxID=915328 RepID=A0A8J7AWX1_9CYAN|nr:hypothetical protein [Romeria gracilis]MBE9077442.1 hypothetical protein [Romeria aff. gracilis LEGE 07310]
MNLKTLKTEEVKQYIRAEREKGRSMSEIVQEIAAVREDFTILSHNPEVAERQMLEALGKPHV